MADSKTSALPAASATSGAELVAIVQGGTDKKATISTLIPSGTYVDVPDPIADGQVPAWDEGTETWVAVDPGTGGSGGGTGGFLSTAKWGTD